MCTQLQVVKQDKENTKNCYDGKIISGWTLQKSVLGAAFHNIIYQEIWLERKKPSALSCGLYKILIYVG